MDTPKRLYKYRAATAQNITNLSAGKLWFSDPATFNDPFDCAYEITIGELSREDCVRIAERVSEGRFNRENLARVSDDALRQQVGRGLKWPAPRKLIHVL